MLAYAGKFDISFGLCERNNVMPDLKRIITESIKLNDLLRDCYSFVDDKELTERYETSIRELKRRINAMDLCYKENVIELNDTLEKYLRDYIEYLKHKLFSNSCFWDLEGDLCYYH